MLMRTGVALLAASFVAEAQPFVMRGLLTGGFLDSTLEQVLLPITVDANSVPGFPAALKFVELQSCGATDNSHVRALAIGYKADASSQVSVRMLARLACQESLDKIASDAVATIGLPPSIVVAALSLSWQPWEAALTVTDARVITAAGGTADLPASVSTALRNSGNPISRVSTAAIPVALDDGSTIKFDLLASFAGDQARIAAAPSGSVAGGAIPNIQIDDLGTGLSVAPGANGGLAVSYQFIDDTLRVHYKDTPFVVEAAGLTFNIKSARVSGSNGQVITKGLVQTQGVGLNLSITWNGSDLGVDSIRVDEAHVCDSLGGLQRVACLAKPSVAIPIGIENLANDRLKHHPLRPLGGQTVGFEFNGKKLGMLIDVQRTTAGPTDLLLYAIIKLAQR